MLITTCLASDLASDLAFDLITKKDCFCICLLAYKKRRDFFVKITTLLIFFHRQNISIFSSTKYWFIFSAGSQESATNRNPHAALVSAWAHS